MVEENKQIKDQMEKIKRVFLSLWEETEQKGNNPGQIQPKHLPEDLEKRMRHMANENDKLKVLLR